MFNHIKSKLLICIIPVVILILLFSYLLIGIASKDIINTEVREKIIAIQNEQKFNIEHSIESIVKLIKLNSSFVEATYDSIPSDNYINILVQSLEDSPNILGTGIWFEPYKYDENSEYVSIYVQREGNEIITTDYYNSKEYNYFNQSFYQQTKEAKDVIFTDIFYDEKSGYFMLSFGSPFFDTEGNFIGCVTADYELYKLAGLVEQYNSVEGTFYIISNDGDFIVSTNEEDVKNGKNIAEYDNPDIANVSYEILNNKNGQTIFNLDKKEHILFYNTITSLDWNIIYIMPTAILTEPANAIFNVYLLITTISILLISVVIIITTDHYIKKPFNILIGEFDKIAKNTYHTIVPLTLLKQSTEMGTLGRSLGIMKTKLKQYQTDLETLLNENKSYSEELSKQNSLLVRSQNSLKEAVAYNQAIIKAIPELVFIISKEGVCLDCQGNPNSHFMPKKYYLKKHINEIMPLEDSTKLLSIIHDVIGSNDIKRFECSFKVAGMEEFYDLQIADCFSDRVIIIARQVTMYYNNLKEIKYLSYHDQVTGLHNRRHYEEKLEEIIKGDVFPLSVITSDLNGLKLINDSFGHSEGDELLKKFALLLTKIGIDFDNIARIGGDEFFIFLPNTDTEQAKDVVNNIEALCQKEEVKGIKLSVSLGVGTMYSNDESLSHVIKLAEDIMYQNKLYGASGRKSNTIDLILRTLEEKNPREQLHSKRVSEICVKISTRLGMSIADQNKMKNAGLLHDIGKIGVPEYILNKPGTLTEEELNNIFKHPEIGYRILISGGNMENIADIVLSHHERWDGKGYPRKLKGTKIPLEARIIAVADTYDAITSERSYRPAKTKEYAINEILKSAGKQFDPEIVKIFINDVVNDLSYE